MNKRTTKGQTSLLVMTLQMFAMRLMKVVAVINLLEIMLIVTQIPLQDSLCTLFRLRTLHIPRCYPTFSHLGRLC